MRPISAPPYSFLLGAVFYWAALPPLGFWPLAFLVPVCWGVAISHPKKLRFRTVYFGAFLFWLASIWWIACPHPATILGLLALSAFVAIYWSLFFAASRIAVQRLKIPAVLAMPICWMGCEYARNHVFGGFSFCSLEHALYRQPLLIQIADISGGYLVGGMIMLVGAGFMETRIAIKDEKRRRPWPMHNAAFPALMSLVILSATFWCGYSHLTGWTIHKGREMTIAALQGNVPVKLDADRSRAMRTYQQFIDLTTAAVKEGRENGRSVDLIVWPETVCPILYVTEKKPGDFAKAGFDEKAVQFWQEQLKQLETFIKLLDTPVLVGLSTLEFDGKPEPARFNSALLIDPVSTEASPPANESRYDKIQLVMFGEYIPFSKYLPDDFFIKTLCQEAGRGAGPVAILAGLGDECFAVNICFESSVPHFVRNQVLSLKEQGRNPAFLINMSNDGWFRFSQQIDQHLATHVFRAVENRRAYVAATNGGFSAIIDAQGRIRSIGERRAAQAVVGEVSLEQRNAPIYHRIGDAIPQICTVFLFACLGLGFLRKEEQRTPQSELIADVER